MTSLWAEYIKEREGFDTIEHDLGFITYTFLPNGDLFIRDMFVRQPSRNSGIGQQLFETLSDVAMKAKAKQFVCQVDTRARNATHSLGVILSRGFQVVDAQHLVITLTREVSNGRLS